MRKSLPLALFLLLTLIPSADAARFLSFEERTGDPIKKYSEVEEEISSIEGYLNNVSCGGWINDDAQELLTPGVMTSVDGAPGRSMTGDPFANISSGLAPRGDFQYPGEAYGYMSACSIYDGAYNPGQYCMIQPQNAHPQSCEDLYHQIVNPTPVNVVCGIPIYGCNHPVFTTPCTGEECRCGVRVTGESFGVGITIKSRSPLSPGPDGECGSSFSVIYPSCVYDADGNLIILSPARYIAGVASFYRHYGPVTSHDAIPDERYQRGFPVVSEGIEQKVAADCYEYYVEKDALVTPARYRNRRCEAYETDDSDANKDSPEWTHDDHPQKTAIEPNRDLHPYTGDEMNPPRPDRVVGLPWIADPKTNLALPVETGSFTFKNLTHILQAQVPIASEAARARLEGRADAFDDATNPSQNGDPLDPATPERMLSIFWQAQQEKLKTILRLPALRIMLPARASVGLDSELNASGRGGPAAGIVELSLHAGDDAVQSVMGSLQNSLLLTPREVRVPVIAPMVSEIELDAKIHEWRQHYGAGSDVDANVQRLLDRFEYYREQIRKVRLLRTATAEYAEGALSAQQQMKQFLAEWYRRNAENISSWSSGAGDRARVQDLWRQVSEEYLRISDECGLRWCSNTRYSLPVYSLLDEWLPGRPSFGALRRVNPLSPTDGGLSLEAIPWIESPDVVADFSAIDLPRRSFSLPVLDVTQIPVTIPSPPLAGDVIPGEDELRELLPDIPVIDDPAALLESFAGPPVSLPELDPSKHEVPANTTGNTFAPVIERLEKQLSLMRRAADDYCAYTGSIAGRDDQPRKIVHTEFDLRERIGRLFARRAPFWQQDYQGRTERLGSRDVRCGPQDVLCDAVFPEHSLSFRWQAQPPADSGEQFRELMNDLRTMLLPVDEEHNPYPDITVEKLKRFFLPELSESADDLQEPLIDIDLLPPRPSGSSSVP